MASGMYIYINRMNDLHYVHFPKDLSLSVASREWVRWLAIYAQKIHLPMKLVRKSIRQHMLLDIYRNRC